jgi:hypothetical protein
MYAGKQFVRLSGCEQVYVLQEEAYRKLLEEEEEEIAEEFRGLSYEERLKVS